MQTLHWHRCDDTLYTAHADSSYMHIRDCNLLVQEVVTIVH